MKKLFTTVALAVAALTQTMATDYTDWLYVTIAGTAVPAEEKTITVEANSDGTYCLSLDNFTITSGGETMNVGNITVDSVEATVDGDVIRLSTDQDIAIEAGDDNTVVWLGPYLGSVPVTVVAEMRGDDMLYAIIDIVFMQRQINVVFGNGGYQIGNSDFENFHTATLTALGSTYTSDEPDHWHSFMSASGTELLLGFAGAEARTYISNEVRPGSDGESSVLLRSSSVMGIAVGNGTMTTGRINVGSATASDTDNNYSYSDLTSTDTDGNGDPFYSVMYGKPDSLTVWMRFKQATHSDDAPYATISATITDESAYQEPYNSDSTYTNIVARAANNAIEESGDDWMQLTVPFDYETFASAGAEQGAILVTVSTNATAGGGSDGDSLLVDDLELIYNYKLQSLSVNGAEVEGFDKDITEYSISSSETINASDIEAVADGAGATVTTELEDSESGVTATITVTSNDLKNSTVYTLDIEGATNGINKVLTTTGDGTTHIYDISGREVSNATHGAYIVRKADGSTYKMIKK